MLDPSFAVESGKGKAASLPAGAEAVIPHESPRLVDGEDLLGTLTCRPLTEANHR